MNGNHRPAQRLIASSVLVSLLGLSACGKSSEEPGQQGAVNTSAGSATTAASLAQAASAAPVAYIPPSADRLYQMVAPIALFPDTLVALVLAGSTYPDQIAAANTWLAQNPNLKGPALATSADQQSWDPSVKALTAFPAVLSQTATNITWTTSLGQAYYSDPTDVLNAIQVMRQRAQASGNLCTTSEIRVTQAKRTSAHADYTPAPFAPHVYEGPAIIVPPPQTIVIAPAQPDVVYVPVYNPAVVYGAPVAVYPGYLYRPPVYVPGAVVTAGAITFGAGVTIGASFGHVGWGWHAWDMHWDGSPSGGRGGWQRPAVVFHPTTYISRSTTVINRSNNTHISYRGTVSNPLVHNGEPEPAMAQMRAQTSALHGNHVTTHTGSEGHLEGQMQIEHQQVPQPTPQYAGRFGRERSAEAPVDPPRVQAVQHRGDVEPPLQTPHEDFEQAHPAGPHPSAPHWAVHHNEHRHRL